MAAARVADRAALFLVAGALLLAFAPRSDALDPAYLKDWPTAEQVLADHQGADRQDTLARQMAALHQLHRSIEDMADARRWHGLTADENRLRGDYWKAAERIRDEVNSTLSNELPPGFNGPFAKPPLRKWYAMQWKYERDPEVRAQTLSRYLPARLLAELGAKKSASDARAGEAGRELLDGLRQPERSARKSFLVPLVGLAILGLLVAVMRSRRRRAVSREIASPQSRATDPHPDVVEAAEEVMDSLEPYLVFARGDRERIPLGAFTNPFVIGFVHEYCKAAFAEISGTGEAGKEDGLRVLEQLSKSTRLAALVGGSERDESPPGPLSEADQRSAAWGAGAAGAVLMAFAGESSLKPEERDWLTKHAPRKDPDAGVPQPMLNAPATRLHPAGPNATQGEKMMMFVFVPKLAKIVSEST